MSDDRIDLQAAVEAGAQQLAIPQVQTPKRLAKAAVTAAAPHILRAAANVLDHYADRLSAVPSVSPIFADGHTAGVRAASRVIVDMVRDLGGDHG